MGITLVTRDAVSARRARLWLLAWIMAASAYAVPIAWNAYEELVRVSQKARARLIEHHRLWEMDANFRGKPENWTRFASRLLSDRQLFTRIAMKYGAQADEIEREYRRDLTLARAEVVVVAVALWAGPLAAVYGLIWLLRRRRHRLPAPKVEPASASDPRYRPPG
jgi:hypothetical protein